MKKNLHLEIDKIINTISSKINVEYKYLDIPKISIYY